MLCRNPYVKGPQAYPCGQCMPCRINRRRTWTHRILLETLNHSSSVFVTLTYDPENLPLSSGTITMPNGSQPEPLPTLRPKDLQDWLKRLRKRIEPLRIRYYAVGEYGDETNRPHYHAALFGYPACLYGQSTYSLRRTSCCPSCDTIKESWGLGQIYVGELTQNSAQYIAGYVTKKMTSKDDIRLSGRYPEFGRMSLRPGIGADALHEVADVLLRLNLVDPEGDVPSALRHGSRLLPLGRYLRRKLRVLVGHDEAAPEKTLKEIEETLRPLFDVAFENSISKKSVLLKEGAQKVLNMETRAKIFKKDKSL